MTEVKEGQIWLDKNYNQQFVIEEIHNEHDDVAVDNMGNYIDLKELNEMEEYVLLEDVEDG